MIIRSLGPSDLRSYRRLRLLSLTTDPNAFFLQRSQAENYPDSFFANELSQGFYGAFEAKKLVGMISLELISPAKIYTLYVDPAYRHRGFGKKLLEHVFMEARQRQVDTLTLSVIAGNQAVALYESLGFSFVERRPGVLQNEHGVFDELVYNKKL